MCLFALVRVCLCVRACVRAHMANVSTCVCKYVLWACVRANIFTCVRAWDSCV